ncbi:MAG: hypothetical protein PHD48_07720 [Alphaproteobacteria bacterium]|nr:hypothetical protein [Alphaproteobacteria bacterium]
MIFRPLIKQATKIASGAYITPWRNHTRAKVMAIGGLANLGYGTLSFALNYAMAGEGMAQSMTYQVSRMAMMGFCAVPLTFWFLSRVHSRLLLFLIQLMGLGVFFIDKGTNELWNALGITLAFAPYIALQEYRFCKNISIENRGNETALNSYLVVIGYSLGLLMGGILLQHNLFTYAAVGGGLCCILGTFFLYVPVTGRNNARKVWSLIGHNKPSTRLSFFFGLFNPMVDGCLPVWMRVLGISPLGASINLSLRPMIGLFFTPIVGWLIQKKGMRASQLGGVGMVIGWTMMAGASHYPWMLAFGLGILSIGSNLLGPMEVSRWFKRRSSAGVISRELLVASGRIPAYALGILTAFTLPLAYPLLGLGISALFMIGTRPTRKGLAWRLKRG